MNPRVRKIATHLDRAPEIARCSRQMRNWLGFTLSYLGLSKQQFPYVARFRDGSSIEFRDLADVATWWQIFYRQIYPVESTDNVIIDAGANFGAFTLYALAHAPRAKIFAVEPFPGTFLRLQRAIQQSGSADRVVLVNAALSSRTGWVSMQSSKMGSQFRRVIDDAGGQQGTPVRAQTLPGIMSAVEGTIDLLKIDIEGSEYPVLLSTPPDALGRIRRIVMEFHPLYRQDAPQPQDLFQHLESAGLAAHEVKEQGDGYGVAYLTRKQPAKASGATAGA